MMKNPSFASLEGEPKTPLGCTPLDDAAYFKLHSAENVSIVT
jgi:hypothetical protein